MNGWRNVTAPFSLWRKLMCLWHANQFWFIRENSLLHQSGFRMCCFPCLYLFEEVRIELPVLIPWWLISADKEIHHRNETLVTSLPVIRSQWSDWNSRLNHVWIMIAGRNARRFWLFEALFDPQTIIFLSETGMGGDRLLNSCWGIVFLDENTSCWLNIWSSSDVQYICIFH